MIGAAAILLGFYALNGGVNRWEAALFLTGGIAYTLWSFHSSRKEGKTTQEEMPESRYNIWLSVLMVMGGLAALVGGAKLFVNAAIVIAHSCGVSEAVIGLTVVAVGTSLPELATSVVAAVKKEQDIAIGNVVGSNIFNILAILGVAPLISPIQTQGISYVDMFLMLGITLLLYPFMKSGMKISRKEGIAFLVIYILYTVYLIFK